VSIPEVVANRTHRIHGSVQFRFDDRTCSLGWRNGSSSESGFENGSLVSFSSNEWPTGSYSWYSD
jgi:hypothetical protein